MPDFTPDKNNTTKYLLIAVAVLLVVGVSIGATLLFTRDGGGGTTSTSAAPSDVASANDTGPVAIITDDPTCKAFQGISDGVAGVQANGWGDARSSLGPSSEWTAAQREQVKAVATAMRNASDKIVNLAKQTPHRVVRELYEQYIAYGRAYADSVPKYVPTNDYLADVNVSIGNAMSGICNAIEYGSANRSVAVPPVAAPTNITPVGDPGQPQRLISTSDSTCADFLQYESKFIADTAEWSKLDPKIAASQWSPEQREIQMSALATFTSLADQMESAGRRSENPILQDFAVLAALYSRAYVASGDNYNNTDSWLDYAALRLLNTVAAACQAAGS